MNVSTIVTIIMAPVIFFILALCIDYLYYGLKINERWYTFLNSLLMISLFIGLILAWYPLHECGDKTLFGQKPFYLGQKILELLVLPIAISFAGYIFERIKNRK
ncbi:TPA: hypothetical protein TYI43_002109 [Streptococcus suis]|nr:hypothetical protein [Streptococcus suis]HEL1949491.1 hypothetical protein [Streptococcus suis]